MVGSGLLGCAGQSRTRVVAGTGGISTGAVGLTTRGAGFDRKPWKDREMRTLRSNRATMPAALSALAALTLATAASAAIQVDVNGQPVRFGAVQPTSIGGRVFIPLRAVAESMKADVRWDASTQTVIGGREGKNFTLPIGSRTANVDGRTVSLDAPARLMYGTTMVPLRFVAEALGAQVGWNNAAQRVSVNLDGATTGGGGSTSTTEASRMVIPANTVVRARLRENISSKSARRGDQIEAEVDNDDQSRLPMGTKLIGVVTEAQASRSGEPGVLDLSFRNAILPDGTNIPIAGDLSSLDKDSVKQAADGRLVARTKQGKKFDAKWVGYGAAGGALLSTIFGGKLLKGALLGAVGGAAYSYIKGQKDRKKVSDVALASGTEFGVRLDQRVSFADNSIFRYNRP
jgi:hypothetical protein